MDSVSWRLCLCSGMGKEAWVRNKQVVQYARQQSAAERGGSLPKVLACAQWIVPAGNSALDRRMRRQGYAASEVSITCSRRRECGHRRMGLPGTPLKGLPPASQSQ